MAWLVAELGGRGPAPLQVGRGWVAACGAEGDFSDRRGIRSAFVEEERRCGMKPDLHPEAHHWTQTSQVGEGSGEPEG